MGIKDTYSAKSAGPKGGVAFVAPVGTELPTDATSELNATFLAGNLGILTDEGHLRKITRTSNTEKDYDGGDYIINQNEYGATYEFTVYDVDLKSVKELLYGSQNVEFFPANATHGNRYKVTHNADALPLQSFVFWTKSGKKMARDVIQYAKVDEIGEMPFKTGEASKVKVTLRVTKNDDNDYIYEYGDDGESIPGPVTVKVVSTGAWRFGVGGQLSAPLSEASTNAEVKAAIEAIAGVTGTVNVTGASAGTYDVTLSDGGTVSVNGAATLS